MIHIIKFTIYCILLIVVATLPLIIGGILLDKKKTLAYIFGFLYIPYFAIFGLLGGFNKTTDILKSLLNLK